MSARRKTAVVICPGRGTYNSTELGVLGKYFHDKALLARFDACRSALGQETLTALDSAPAYSLTRHTRSDNASPLIYAATLADFRAVESVDVVAVTGNSMGWYSALACAGALSAENGFEVVNTMGTLMNEHLIGGQIIYPFVGDDWAPDPERKRELLEQVAEINVCPDHILTLSIDLGGMLVLAGNELGLKAFTDAAPRVNDRFPMRLYNHGAYHSHLQAPVAALARGRLSPELFREPTLPLVDGRGAIWWPHSSTLQSLWDYTFGYQITETYDFTAAVRAALREFAPDMLVITGPGITLGGVVIQSIISTHWRGIRNKAEFALDQDSAMILASMGQESQRSVVAAFGTIR